MAEDRFWVGVEKIETDYIADCDQQRFKRRMRRRGFDETIILERMSDIDEASSLFSGRPS